MISRYRVSLGEDIEEAAQLDELDENLMILDVSYPPLKPQNNPKRVANLDGYEYGEEYIERGTVTITFELHIYGIAARNAACQKVNAWAQEGGILRVNDREGQRLAAVKCVQYAAIASARNWTDPLTLVFSTTGEPLWESEEEDTLAMTGKSVKGNLAVGGNRGNAKVSVKVLADAAVTSFQITAGDTMLKLSGISLEAGKQMEIGYVNGRYLFVNVDGKSVMDKIDASSSDLLTVPCGKTTQISCVSSGKVTLTITARGLWLW